jgi:LuxR family maltose regulon positive regulatory protein
MLLDAQIARSQDDQARALEMIADALEIAHGDIALPFLRVTGTFADLLARHPPIAAQWPGPAPDGPPDAVTLNGLRAPRELPEPLTEREHALLLFLATSMTTAEIAAELCVSVNTVKTHMASIYRKLAARKRREAVLRARQLELL